MSPGGKCHAPPCRARRAGSRVCYLFHRPFGRRETSPLASSVLFEFNRGADAAGGQVVDAGGARTFGRRCRRPRPSRPGTPRIGSWCHVGGRVPKRIAARRAAVISHCVRRVQRGPADRLSAVPSSPPRPPARPTRRPAAEPRRTAAGRNRRGFGAASARIAAGTAFDHGAKASADVRANGSAGTATATNGAVSQRGQRP